MRKERGETISITSQPMVPFTLQPLATTRPNGASGKPRCELDRGYAIVRTLQETEGEGDESESGECAIKCIE